MMNLVINPWRISGISGLLFVALSFVAMSMNVLPPSYHQGEQTLRAWISENGEWYRIGHLVAGFSFLLFYFPFFAGFCERLRIAEGTPALWSRVTWAGAIISPATGTVAGAFIVGLTFLGHRVSPEVAEFGAAAHFYAYVVSGAYSGVVMISAAIIIIRTSVISRWLGWAGAAIGAAALVGTAAIVENQPDGMFTTINNLAWLAYFLWIAGLSIEQIRQRKPS